MKKLLFALSTVFLTFSAALPVQAEEITIQLPELYDYSYRITKGGLSIVDGSGTLAPSTEGVSNLATLDGVEYQLSYEPAFNIGTPDQNSFFTLYITDKDQLMVHAFVTGCGEFHHNTTDWRSKSASPITLNSKRCLLTFTLTSRE